MLTAREGISGRRRFLLEDDTRSSWQGIALTLAWSSGQLDGVARRARLGAAGAYWRLIGLVTAGCVLGLAARGVRVDGVPELAANMVAFNTCGIELDSRVQRRSCRSLRCGRSRLADRCDGHGGLLTATASSNAAELRVEVAARLAAVDGTFHPLTSTLLVGRTQSGRRSKVPRAREPTRIGPFGHDSGDESVDILTASAAAEAVASIRTLGSPLVDLRHGEDSHG
jgi:hypothetical protein